MKFVILLSALISTAGHAGTLSCELIYAKNGSVQKASGSIEVPEGKESDALELSIKNLVEVQVFRGSNGKISAHMDRIGGESNYNLTDGNLLHLTAENRDEGRALTCSYQ